MEDIGWIQSGFEWQSDDPLHLRASSQSSHLDHRREELARVFLALGRRGYQSNQKGLSMMMKKAQNTWKESERDERVNHQRYDHWPKHLELLLVNGWSTLKNRTYSEVVIALNLTVSGIPKEYARK